MSDRNTSVLPRGNKDVIGKKISADELWEVAWTYIKTVVDTAREPFLIIDKDLRVLSANRTFYRIFQSTTKQTEGQLVYSLGDGQWDIAKLRVLLEDILSKNTYFEGFKVEHDFPKIGHRIMILNARKIHKAGEKRQIILLAMEDVTKQKKLEDQSRDYTKRLALEVGKRTVELEARVKEMESLNKTMIGRELKMVELKKEIEDLKKQTKDNAASDQKG